MANIMGKEFTYLSVKQPHMCTGVSECVFVGALCDFSLGSCEEDYKVAVCL